MDGSGHLLHIKDGLTQGVPLTMIFCGIGIHPLICEICATHPHITQTWYVDGAGTRGGFAALQEHMRDLVVR